MKKLKLKVINNISKNSQKNERAQATPIINKQVSEVFSRFEQVEKNKDQMDLAPNINFVSQNIDIFELGLKKILQRAPSSFSDKWNNLNIDVPDTIHEPQILPDMCKKILDRMPDILIQLSDLVTIDYKSYGNDVIIPGFDENGNIDFSNITILDANKFPLENQHPSRIFVGASTGDTIQPTTIPESVSNDEKARYLYQIHVFLHEFFHTIESLKRSPSVMKKIHLKVDNQKFSFYDWWNTFENLILSNVEPNCVSMYANNYFEKLNAQYKKENPADFTHSLAEQIAETFVAYQLGIISNNENWTDFQNESFGNSDQLQKFTKKEASAANLKWILMDKLCRAKKVK